jgi:hypothetical protein
MTPQQAKKSSPVDSGMKPIKPKMAMGQQPNRQIFWDDNPSEKNGQETTNQQTKSMLLAESGTAAH